MKKIALRIYLAKNLGDDIFLKIVSERYPNVIFHTCPTLRYKNNNFRNNIQFYDSSIDIIRNKVLHKLKIYHFDTDSKIKKMTDATVIIGGSIFHEPPTWIYTRKRLEMYNNLNKKYYILSCNFGPYMHESFFQKHKNIINEATDVCFRDKKSYDLFNNCNNARMEYDVAFSLKRKINNKNNKNNKYDNAIVFSIIDLSWRKTLKHKTEEYEELILNMIKRYAKTDKVILMGFSSHEGDNNAINRIYGNLSPEEKKRTSIYLYDGDIDEALNILEQSKGIIATRYHANVLGILYGKKILPIIYDIKTSNLLEDVHYAGKIININDITKENIKQLSNIKCNNNISQEIVDNIIKSSNKQFLKLDELLK